MNPTSFIENWLNTNGNPCLVCGKDKFKCNYYRELVESGIIDEHWKLM